MKSTAGEKRIMMLSSDCFSLFRSPVPSLSLSVPVSVSVCVCGHGQAANKAWHPRNLIY